MRQEHIPFLSDPITHESFSVFIFESNKDHISSGLLITQSGSWYPIIGGIPRILVHELKENLLQFHQAFFKMFKDRFPINILDDWRKAINAIPDMNIFLKHQKKTAESFSYEWKYIYRENDIEKRNFFHFAGPFITEENLKGMKTLDIGCGSGRFTKWAALSGTEVSFGSDLGETVEVAYAMTKDIPNVCIVQADIYAMPFQKIFDIAYSIGVLHHLPNPKEGFFRLLSVLKEGGDMVIWVYNRRGNIRALYFYEPLRMILKTFSKPLLFKFSYVPAFVVHLINYLTLFFRKIHMEKIATKIPFSYYSSFPFNMKLNDAFDVIATPKSNYYYREEIECWFRDASLKNIRAYEHPEAGITCIGTYGL